MKNSLLILSLCSFLIVNSQESATIPLKAKEAPSAKRITSIYAELGGPGLLYSVNVDVRFLKSHVGPGIRVGGGAVAAGGFSFYSIPMGLNYIVGKGTQTFEMGAGATVTNLTKSFVGGGLNVIGNITLAYRVQPMSSGVSFRIGLVPMFGYETNFYLFPYGCMSVGYAF